MQNTEFKPNKYILMGDMKDSKKYLKESTRDKLLHFMKNDLCPGQDITIFRGDMFSLDLETLDEVISITSIMSENCKKFGYEVYLNFSENNEEDFGFRFVQRNFRKKPLYYHIGIINWPKKEK